MVSTQERAMRLAVRLYTSAKAATFRASVSSAYTGMFRSDAQQSHEPWTLFVRFQMWAARAAFEEKYGGGAVLAEGEEKVAADAIGFVEEDVEGDVVRPVDPADLGRAGVVVTVNQRNDWLHRGCRLRFLDLWGYSQYVTRVDMPLGGEEKLGDNDFLFEAHYGISATSVQRYCPRERPPKLPVVEGFRCPTAEADPEMNALFKSVLFQTCECTAAGADGRCDKLLPYEKLGCRRGFGDVWKKWEMKLTKRAQKFERFCAHHQVYPTLCVVEELQAVGRLPGGSVGHVRRWWQAYEALEVVRNIDAIAAAKGRPRRPLQLAGLEEDAGERRAAEAGEGGWFRDGDSGRTGCEERGGLKPGKDGLLRPDHDVRDAEVEGYAAYRYSTQSKKAGRDLAAVRGVMGGPDPAEVYRVARQRIESRAQRGEPTQWTLGCQQPPPGDDCWCLDDPMTTVRGMKEKWNEEEAAWQEKRHAGVDVAEGAKVAGGGVPREVREGTAEVKRVYWAQKGWDLACAAHLNDDQGDAAALQCEAMVRREAGDEEFQSLLLLFGEGGTGKTWVANGVIRPLARLMRGMAGERGLCHSNAAARVLGDDATTCHMAIAAARDQKFDLRSLDGGGASTKAGRGLGGCVRAWGTQLRPGASSVRGRGVGLPLCRTVPWASVLHWRWGVRADVFHAALCPDLGRDRLEKLTPEWRNILGLVLDECGAMGAALVHSVAYCATLGRANAHDLDRAKYCQQPFGRIASVVLQGDYMQLPPVQTQGLAHHILETSSANGPNSLATQGAWEIYRRVRNLVRARPGIEISSAPQQPPQPPGHLSLRGDSANSPSASRSGSAACPSC